MMTGTFRLIAFDEGGERGSPENLRLVCQVDGGGKLAIWGTAEHRGNIEAVLVAGVPCTVECEVWEPEPWADNWGHTHWVPQSGQLKVLT